MFYKTADGKYSYYSFSIIIEDNIDVSNIIKNNNSTFTHEYIHYLQNISLPYLIKHTLLSFHKVCMLFSDIIKNSNYPRPFKCDEDATIRELNKELGITLGKSDIEDIYNIINIDNISCEVAYIKNIEAYTRIFQHKLVFNTNDYDDSLGINKKVDYYIGAIDLLEYIAYKIENKFFGTSNLPNIPYKTIDYVFEYYKVQDIPDEVKILLVEFSLYNDNPIHTLLCFLLERLTKDGIEIKIENEIYRIKDKDVLYDYDTCKCFLSSIKWTTNATGDDTIFTKSERRYKQIKDIIPLIYGKENFNYINQWIDKVISFYNNNLKNEFIFSKLFSMNKKDFVDYINKTISDIGIPLIMNNQCQCASNLPFYDKEAYNEFLLFYITEKLMASLIENNNKRCPIIDWCSANKGNPNATCINNPLSKFSKDKNSKEYRDNCAFLYFVSKFNLWKIKW